MNTSWSYLAWEQMHIRSTVLLQTTTLNGNWSIDNTYILLHPLLCSDNRSPRYSVLKVCTGGNKL
jgi:hypothetical protein